MPSITQLAIITLVGLSLILLLVAASGFQADLFGHLGQGAAGFASVVALVCAAGLYYHERHNMPKVVLQPPVAVVGPVRGRGERAVLLHVALTVENRSTQPFNVRCAALDLIGIDGSGTRNSTYYDDLAGISLLDPPPDSTSFEPCVKGYEAGRRSRERAQRHAQEAGRQKQEARRREGRRATADEDEAVNPPQLSVEATTGARFSDFLMEPGESVTKTWDQVVSCKFQAVQVIFKVPKPGDVIDYEVKTLVPIAEECGKAGPGGSR